MSENNLPYTAILLHSGGSKRAISRGLGGYKTQGACTTTALALADQGLGGGAYQQAFCKF